MTRSLMIRAAVLALPVLAACTDAPGPAAPDGASAPLSAGAAAAGAAIPEQYIVVFKADVADPPGLARRLAAASGGELRFIYDRGLKGFAARIPAAAAEGLAHHPDVAYVEADQVMQAVETQTGATWGLDRIDQVNLPLSGTYTYANNGTGVVAYIIDTGIRFDHTEFGVRATSGYDAVDGGSADDCNGHGTHVAGTVGGITYGVAKGASLKAVRVLDCGGSGSNSGVIAGINWVTGDHAAGTSAVANMSLGGGFSQALNDAVTASINDGVVYALAAGNGNFFGTPQNACNNSPASTPAALTVGATDKTDKEAYFSNYGTCVDILAPGVDITSAWYNSASATNTISGTSMATPHVAGAAALYLAANPGANPAAVGNALVSNASVGKITLHNKSASGGTPNKLLYAGFIGGGGPVNAPPVAAFTFSCTDLACTFDGSGSTDSDGTIDAYAWNFGDGATGNGQNPSHTYASGGTRTVTLTVTDNALATGSVSQAVTVTAPGGGGISLSARGYKVKGVQHADLTWSGATSTNVDVYRNGANVVTTLNDGRHDDNIGAKGGGSYTYQVCEAGSSTCSAEVQVNF